MDQSETIQNRRTKRSNLLMKAVLRRSIGDPISVTLRNLSAEGALVEADVLPLEGTNVTFEKGDLKVQGRVAWVEKKRAGIHFRTKLEPEAVLRHVPAPRPRVKPDFRRPGLAPQPINEFEARMAENYVWAPPHSRGDD